MGRLIDADALKRSLTIISAKGNVSVGSLLAFLNFIDEQPTAYDVEAVVKELIDKIEENNASSIGAFYTGYRYGLQDAIEIVTKGGVKNE